MEKQTAIAALAALAHETRLDVFRLLVRAGSEGLSAGTVGEQLGIPAATLSFHLKELKGAGLIRCERDGRSRIYSPDFAAMNALLAYLTENCCGGLGAACGVRS
ncbi:MAG: helix-turn-helix transcriptional regulator [Deltaproteobacteria bacterium]|nr:helix-turn-helix transcriptional regulator [Deltaproteobacteria bacterium]